MTWRGTGGTGESGGWCLSFYIQSEIFMIFLSPKRKALYYYFINGNDIVFVADFKIHFLLWYFSGKAYCVCWESFPEKNK